jgi:hypothetical protein
MRFLADESCDFTFVRVLRAVVDLINTENGSAMLP